MLTNNYWLVYATQITGNPSGLTYKDYSGYERACVKTTRSDYGKDLLDSLMFNHVTTVLQTKGSNKGVMFGDGATASKEDYKLSGNLISGISVSTSTAMENSEEGCTRTTVYTITNNNDADITISEIGYQSYIPNGASSIYVALLEHTILDAPITIPAGGVGQVTYTIRMNYPTA